MRQAMAEYCIAVGIDSERPLYYCGHISAWTADKSRASRFRSEEEAKLAISRLSYGMYTILKEETNG